MSRISLKGRWAVVTGADSGIGLCFCRELAGRGCNVVMVSNMAERLDKAAADVAREFGVETLPIFSDLTRPQAAEQLYGRLDEAVPDWSILINNAGIFSFRELIDTPAAKADAFVDLHCRAVTQLSRLAAQHLARRGEGYILNMSSMSCWTPMPGLSLYAATKAYIRVLSRSLHYEMRTRGVRVMVACSGGIATDLFGLPENLKRLAVRIGALDTPQGFARRAVSRLLRGRMQYINGPLNRIGIVAVGLTPTPLRMMVKSRLLDKGITR